MWAALPKLAPRKAHTGRVGSVMACYSVLDDRGVLTIAGDDRVAFLQGLTSNDVGKASAGRTLFSAFLTPQGKYLHDFMIAELGGTLLLDCEAARRDDLLRRLKLFRLRAKVTLEDATASWAVVVAFGDGAAAAFGLDEEAGWASPYAGGLAYVDPRLAALGVRLLLPREAVTAALGASGLVQAGAEDYDRHRLALGVPDGSRDIAVEKATLLESNFDELHAIAWDKGCYMGQELTARTKYRGLLKRRLVPVAIDGPLPAPGTEITLDGRAVGEMRSGRDGHGIALLRLDALAADGGALLAGDRTVRPQQAAWLADPSPSTET